MKWPGIHYSYNRSKTNFSATVFIKCLSHQACFVASSKRAMVKLLVFAFNALEYTNLLKKTEQDPENNLVKTTLIATFLSTVNEASDVMTPAVEHGINNTVLTTSIKWVGSLAGTTASALVLGVDFVSGHRELTGKMRWQYISLSLGKIGSDIGITIKALGGLLELVEKSGVRFAARGLISRILTISAVQLIGFIASWQVMIALLVIEQLIIYFSDDDLQYWCKASVFGEKPESLLTSTEKIELLSVRNDFLKKQEDDFNKAVKMIQ